MSHSALSLVLLSLLVNCGNPKSETPEQRPSLTSAQVFSGPGAGSGSLQTGGSAAGTTDGATKDGFVSIPITPGSNVTDGATITSSADLQAAFEAFTGRAPELKRAFLNGHHWNVKPATIERVGDTIQISGQLSHNIRLSLDDQLYYKVRIKDGLIDDFALRVENRNWVGVAGSFLPLLQKVIKINMPIAEFEKIVNRADVALYKDWEEQAKILILHFSSLVAKQK